MITKRDKLLIFPYNYKTFPMVKLLLKNNYNVKVSTFPGLGLIGRDVSISVNRQNLNNLLLEYTDYLLEDLDVLYIPEFNNDTVTNDIVANVIAKAVEKNIQIILESKLEVMDEFKEYEKKICLQTLVNPKIEADYAKTNLYNMKFYRPPIPVVYVGGIHDLIDNDYVLIALKDYLERNGYKTCCISREISNKLFGCIGFPEEFINEGRSIEDRILSLNAYIKSSIDILNPDILIIQIPNGMIQYNDYFHNSFGGYTYLISQAVKGDYFICSVTTEIFSQEHHKRLSQYFSKRIDIPISCLHLSNCVVDIPYDTRAQNKDILFLRESEIDVQLLDYNHNSEYKSFNLFKEDDIKTLYDDIINKFA